VDGGLVAAAAQLLDDGVCDPGALVGCNRDAHRQGAAM